MIRRGCLSDRMIARDGPEPGVGLAMAVRAEQDALRELSLNLLPRTENAVGGNGEVFPAGVEVMELEEAGMNRATAAHARSTER